MVFDLFKTKQVATIGCFGKLPIYADFIKIRADIKELDLFDKWIQEGIHFSKTRLKDSFKDNYHRSLHYNFLYQPKNSDKSIVGILFPGMDKSDRISPFVIFIPTSKYQMNYHLGIFIGYLQDIFYPKAFKIAKHGWEGLESDEFLKKFSNWEILLNFEKKYEEQYKKFLKNETVGSYFSSLHGDLDGGKRYLIFQNLIDVTKPLTKDNFPRFSLGIKFPLSSQPTKYKYEITFWTDLIFKIFPLKKIFPSLFWNNAENSLVPNLFFYLNEPLPKHFFSLLHADSSSDDNICDLSEMRFSKIDDIKNSMMEKHYNILKHPETTLHTFLKSL
jgi:type VI secretion system protein ImpM